MTGEQGDTMDRPKDEAFHALNDIGMWLKERSGPNQETPDSIVLVRDRDNSMIGYNLFGPLSKPLLLRLMEIVEKYNVVEVTLDLQRDPDTYWVRISHPL